MKPDNGKNDFEHGYIAGAEEMMMVSSVVAVLFARNLIPDFHEDDDFLLTWIESCMATFRMRLREDEEDFKAELFSATLDSVKISYPTGNAYLEENPNGAASS